MYVTSPYTCIEHRTSGNHIFVAERQIQSRNQNNLTNRRSRTIRKERHKGLGALGLLWIPETSIRYRSVTPLLFPLTSEGSPIY